MRLVILAPALGLLLACGGTSGGSSGSGGMAVPSVGDTWEEVYTCLRGTECLGENIAITVLLSQNGADVDWEVTAGQDLGSTYSGTLASDSFDWESTASTVFETGCWEFNGAADAFNKRSAGTDFVCIGIGSRGAGSDPDPSGLLLDCAELGAAGPIDFGACPPAPPAAPEE